MEIHLTARRIKLTQAIRDYVTEKVEKAQKYFDHIVWAQVILLIEKRAHKAEIVIHAPRHTFRALAAASDLYSAVDLASDKIDAQLKKFKERLKDHHKTRREPPTKEPVPEAPERIFSITKAPTLPLTPEQAAARLEETGNAFLLFQDHRSSQLQVIYRRGDDSYGILQPVRKGGR